MAARRCRDPKSDLRGRWRRHRRVSRVGRRAKEGESEDTHVLSAFGIMSDIELAARHSGTVRAFLRLPPSISPGATSKKIVPRCEASNAVFVDSGNDVIWKETS